MRQDGKHGFTRGTLNAPDGETAQADSDIMGVARQAPAATTRGLVGELEADRQDKGEDELDKRFGVAQEGKVGRLIVEIDSDGAVFASRFGSLSPVASPCRWPLVRMKHREGNVLKDQVYCERFAMSPLKSVECEAPRFASREQAQDDRQAHG